MAVTTYIFNQSVGAADYADNYFTGQSPKLETVFATYKTEVHYWEVSGVDDLITIYSHDNQVLNGPQQAAIHALLDDLSSVEAPNNAQPYNSQTPDNVLEITAAVDATYDVTKQYRYIYLTASAGAIVTLNLNISDKLDVGESFEIVMSLAFTGGAGLSLDGLAGDVFDGSGDANLGINVDGTYAVIIHKLAGGVQISVGLKTPVPHTQVIIPEMYIKFDGVDSHFEVAIGNLTGNLANILDMSQSWTATGIIREHSTGSGDCMFNRWANCFGLSYYNGSNVFFSAINGNGGGYYFDSPHRYTDFVGQRFFIVNTATEIICYIGDQAVKTITHAGANTTSPNGQLIVGLRKHSTTILQQYGGGLDDVLLFNVALISAQRLEVVASSDHTTLSNYSDVGAWWKMGEDVFPDIHDEKRNVDNTYLNGLATDYKEV